MQNELVPGEVVPSVAFTAEQATYGIVLVLASLALAAPVMALARRLFPGRNVFFARWGFSHVALVVAFYFALATAGGIALAAADASRFDDALSMIVFEAGLQGAVVILVFGIARKLDPAGARSLGFGPGNNLHALLLAFVAYLAALPGLQGIGAAWGWALESLGQEPVPQKFLVLVAELSGWKLAAFAALAVVVVPFFEEVLFRGFVQPLLVQNLGDRGGVAVTAILFAGIHLSVFAFVPLLALALVLGTLMLKTRRIVATWFLHGLHNAVTILFVTLGAQEHLPG